MKRLAILLAIVLAAGALILIFVLGDRSSSSPKATASPAATALANPSGLPGLLTGPAPWTNNTAKLAQRLNAIGLPQLGVEGTALHTHQHIDLIINGTPVTVPAEIGIPDSQAYISTIHTHDTSGIVHVESPTIQTFYLGQFFDIWGVQFTQNCLGNYCSGGGNDLTVYVNGAKYTGNPRDLKLASHQEITIVYGPAGSTPTPLPTSYPFPSGY